MSGISLSMPNQSLVKRNRVVKLNQHVPHRNLVNLTYILAISRSMKKLSRARNRQPSMLHLLKANIASRSSSRATTLGNAELASKFSYPDYAR
jgi:hypothetical protein